MKKLLSIGGLILLLFNSVFSQTYSYSLPDNGTFSLRHDTIISGIHIDSLLSTVNPDKIYQYQALPELMKRYSVEDHMPCIVPKGNYSLLIAKPDTTARCKLLIKKP